MIPGFPPLWLPAVATSIALRASRLRPVWKKIAVPSDAKAGEKAFAVAARTAWMARTWSSTCSTGPLDGFGGAVGAAAETPGDTRAEGDGLVAARRSVIAFMTAKPTANEARSAAKVA